LETNFAFELLFQFECTFHCESYFEDSLGIVLVALTMGKIFYYSIQQGIPCRFATSLFPFYYFPLEMHCLFNAFIYASHVI